VQPADIRLNAEMKRSDPFNVLWLQAGSCGGCTMSALESGAAGWFEELFAFGVELLWHPSVSEATGGEALAILDSVERGARRLDALVVEGSVLCGPDGTGAFNKLSGSGRSLLDWISSLAPLANYCVAVGSCAAFGGVPAAAPDPTDARGLQYRAREIGGALGPGSEGIERIRVTLHESHVARAWFEGPVGR